MLTADEAQLLDRLTLAAGFSSASASPSGVRRARLRGLGVEFHEHRQYQPGDVPRSIDWNVEARLRQLVVRVSRAHGHMPLHVLVDCSASMGIGSPAKLECARKAAAALCYVAIERRDAAGASTFASRIETHIRAAAGRAYLFRIFSALSKAAAGGESAIDQALEAFAAVVRPPALVVVLSDFFGADSKLRGVRALMHRGLTPALVQVVAPEDLDPRLATDTELMDAEREDDAAVVAAPSVVAAYHERVDAHAASLRAFCATSGLSWLRIDSSGAFPDLLSSLESVGLFQL